MRRPRRARSRYDDCGGPRVGRRLVDSWTSGSAAPDTRARRQATANARRRTRRAAAEMGEIMRRLTRRLGLATIAGAGLAFVMAQGPAHAWDRGNVDTFAVLPEGATGPEGITVGRDGNVYVTTFGFNAAGGPAPGPGQLFVFREKDGQLIRQVSVAGSTSRLLGLAFHPSTNALLVIDSGGEKVLTVDPNTGGSSPFTSIPGSVLNALTFDQAGNVYISDSTGKIWKTGASGGAATLWPADGRLATTAWPPCVANVLPFN